MTKTNRIIVGLVLIILIAFALALGSTNAYGYTLTEPAYAKSVTTNVAAPAVPKPRPTHASRAVPAWVNSRVGVFPSVYRGKYYDARYERVRRCIVKRESMGHYGVVNRSSGAAGAYQFLPSTARVAKVRMGKSYLSNHANTWSRADQDQAFWTLWNHGKGRGHWAGGRWSC